MLSKLQKKQEGFTIIEVLIVLAIAGLIMLIVFLAVPALQRNSRNTQRTSDASRIATAVSNWVSNNNGKVFTAGTGNANITAVIADAGTLGQYELVASGATATQGVLTVVTGLQSALPVANIRDMRVVTGARCGDNGATLASTNTRESVLQYVKEPSTGTCINI